MMGSNQVRCDLNVLQVRAEGIDPSIPRRKATLSSGLPMGCEIGEGWGWTTKFDTATWPFLRFDMQHRALVTRQKGVHL